MNPINYTALCLLLIAPDPRTVSLIRRRERQPYHRLVARLWAGIF